MIDKNPIDIDDLKRNELIRLKAHLDLVEEGRIAGSQGISVEEARIRLMEKYKES